MLGAHQCANKQPKAQQVQQSWPARSRGCDQVILARHDKSSNFIDSIRVQKLFAPCQKDLALLVQLLALFLHPPLCTRLLLCSVLMMLKLLKPLMQRRAFHCVEKKEAWVQVLKHNMVLEHQIV